MLYRRGHTALFSKVARKAIFAENSRPESIDGSRIGQKRSVFSVTDDV